MKNVIEAAVLIPVDEQKPVQVIAPTNGKRFTYAELYKLLDCSMVELLPLSDGRVMVLDEESKMVRNPQRNERATVLAGFASPEEVQAYINALQASGVPVYRVGHESVRPDESDYIAGDALVCQEGQV